MNEVTGTNEILFFEPPVPMTGAGIPSLERNPKNAPLAHI